MAKNIVIAGLPGTGKSTLLKSVLDSYDGMMAGLITTEIKENEKRIGFKMGIHYKGANENPFARTIAHVGINSEISVSNYRINVSEINKQASERLRAGFGQNYLLYLDEVGEMQLHSNPFSELAKKYLDAQNICIMTVSKKYKSAFIDAIKNREDIELIELTPENRDGMKTYILDKIVEYSKNK